MSKNKCKNYSHTHIEMNKLVLYGICNRSVTQYRRFSTDFYIKLQLEIRRIKSFFIKWMKLCF